MKYFIDTEFIEDFTRPLIGKPRHYIDLISIAIVAEDGREYYAVSNEFDIDHVWNKYQMKRVEQQIPNEVKEYWLRDNVLMPLVYDLARKDDEEKGAYMADWKSPKKWLDYIKYNAGWERIWRPRTKELIKKYGKSNKQIAQEISDFCSGKTGRLEWVDAKKEGVTFVDDPNGHVTINHGNPEFYGYYADYDWVLFCSLYGRMLDLPKDFPMYCRDLKQMFDEAQSSQPPDINLKNDGAYPKQSNAHNALDDARWNKRLYRFLKVLQD